jgi:photosystem II stability/assembly factor-like uncharacterized protein
MLALVLLALVGTAQAGASPRPVTIDSLAMLDPSAGYAIGGPYGAYRLLRTTDGGRSWLDITPDGLHPTAAPTLVSRTTVLLSAQLRPHVFAVLRSDDAGKTWTRSQPFRFARGLDVWSPVAADSAHLFVGLDEGAAAGSQGEALFASSDGGHAWRFISGTSFERIVPGALPFGCDKNGFAFATPRRGWAGGNCAGGRPFFYRTDDGGRTWRAQRLAGLGSCECDISAPTFFTRREGVVIVSGAFETTQFRPLARVYWTDDGGRSWRGSHAPWGRPSLAAAVAARGVAWIVTSRRGSIKPPYNRLFRTTDAGRTWRTAILPFDAEYDRLDVLDGLHAFAYSAATPTHSLYSTDDGGRTWRRVAAYSAN